MGYPDLWPSAECQEPLDVSKEFTFKVIEGILSGKFSSSCCLHLIQYGFSDLDVNKTAPAAMTSSEGASSRHMPFYLNVPATPDSEFDDVKRWVAAAVKEEEEVQSPLAFKKQRPVVPHERVNSSTGDRRSPP